MLQLRDKLIKLIMSNFPTDIDNPMANLMFRMNNLCDQLQSAIDTGCNVTQLPNPLARLSTTLPFTNEALKNAKIIRAFLYEMFGSYEYSAEPDMFHTSVQVSEYAIQSPAPIHLADEIPSHTNLHADVVPQELVIPTPAKVVDEKPAPIVEKPAPVIEKVVPIEMPISEKVQPEAKKTRPSYISAFTKTQAQPGNSSMNTRSTSNTKVVPKKTIFNKAENRFEIDQLEIDATVLQIYSRTDITLAEKVRLHDNYKIATANLNSKFIVDIADVCLYAITGLSEYAKSRGFSAKNINIINNGVEYKYSRPVKTETDHNGNVRDISVIRETHTYETLNAELSEYAFQNENNLYYGAKFINIVMSLLYIIREGIESAQIGTEKPNELTNTLTHMTVMNTIIMLTSIASLNGKVQEQIRRFIHCICYNTNDSPNGPGAGMRICADVWYQ